MYSFWNQKHNRCCQRKNILVPSTLGQNNIVIFSNLKRYLPLTIFDFQRNSILNLLPFPSNILPHLHAIFSHLPPSQPQPQITRQDPPPLFEAPSHLWRLTRPDARSVSHTSLGTSLRADVPSSRTGIVRNHDREGMQRWDGRETSWFR